MSAWTKYTGATNPPTTGGDQYSHWYNFTIGDADFFMMETRGYRTFPYNTVRSLLLSNSNPMLIFSLSRETRQERPF